MTTRDAHRRANIPCYSGTLEQTAAHEAPQQAAATYVRWHGGDGEPVDGDGGMEDGASGGRGREHAVDDDTVKVQVAVERLSRSGE